MERLVVTALVLCFLHSAVGESFPFKLPALGYGYDALEPSIDQETMVAHHTRHHAGYVKKLNAALDGSNATSVSLDDLMINLKDLDLDDAKLVAVQHNGGGHWNHRLYWKVMSPEGSLDDMCSDLAAAIARTFGRVEDLQEQFKAAASSVFGSGWAWLCVDFETGELLITTTANQNNPLMPEEYVEKRCQPILGVDVWEHAYYLLRKWDRGAYLDAFWGLIDWKEVCLNYDAAETV